MLVTARWILTGANPPLKDGALLVEEDTIRDLGTRQWFAKRDVGDLIDLGETILVPGFVNAHCHMEFSSRGGEGQTFTQWVREMASAGAPPAAPLQNTINELIRGGTTTVADHCNPGNPAAPSMETPFRRITFWEVLGADKDRARRSLAAARERVRNEGGFITPHSLYAVDREVLEEIFRDGGGAPQSIHILESSDEDQFFREGSGPLADLVRERGGRIPFPEQSPIQWLREHEGLGPGTLLIHGNYLSEEEIRLLRGTGASVIHCPGSHRFFGHRPFSIDSYFRDVPVALGTDSLASTASLSMIRQMKLAKETMPGLGEEEILKMATVNGARALGLEEKIGTLAIGKKADLVGIPLKDEKVDPYEALLLADEVCFSMVGGQVVYHV